ncbi:N-acetyl-gamma-glutamyl-phosphate reductase [Aliikangiella sp. IMCC44632]
MSNLNEHQYSVGIVGIRGYVGQRLLAIIDQHPKLKIVWVSSRQLQGKSILQLSPKLKQNRHLLISHLSPQQVATSQVEVLVLALPNGLAKDYLVAIENASISPRLIIDLSADHRFDSNWHYALPELQVNSQQRLPVEASNSIKLSNPGCYATAMQLLLKPLCHLLKQPANCFGVSGYSGAGTHPNRHNNQKNLRDNLIGYQLSGHLHEQEVSHQLNFQVKFSPHVTSAFSGIHLTAQICFQQPQSYSSLRQYYKKHYAKQPFVEWIDGMPSIKHVCDTPNALIGGLHISDDGLTASLVCCLDNLLKGAASQAVQNINLALGLCQTLGIVPSKKSFCWVS